MPSWVPGYGVLEGPEETGLAYRYRGVREQDGAEAWIRVDGFNPASSDAAAAVDAVYAATALLDHPLLPPVLDFGSTEVAGRSYIAFQLSRPAAGGGRRTRRGTMVSLAEVQIAALECGCAGIHLPLAELLRLREGARLEARHLPVNEFLCEPRGEAGHPAFAGIGIEAEAGPFAAPEIHARARSVSARLALAFRLAAQIHVVLEGQLPNDAPSGDADKTIALAALATPARGSAETDVPRELVRLGLSPIPELRPDLEDFAAVRLPLARSA
jgi:hypothetical protein